MRPRDGEGRLAMKLQLSVDIVVCFFFGAKEAWSKLDTPINHGSA